MQKLIHFLGWGFVLWFIGYVLGFVLFFLVPKDMIGWVLTPIGVIITWWVLVRRIQSRYLMYSISLGLCWSVMAVVFDYFGIVLMLKTGASYYKLDVLLYYFLTAVLPSISWFWTQRNSKTVRSVLHTKHQ